MLLETQYVNSTIQVGRPTMDKVEMEHDSEVSSITNSSYKPKFQVQIVFNAADLEFSATLATKLYLKCFISVLLG